MLFAKQDVKMEDLASATRLSHEELFLNVKTPDLESESRMMVARD